MESPIIFDAGIIGILLIFSAFFSSSETALTALSRAKIHKLHKKGNKRAKHVSKIRKDKDLLISSILIGNNVVNILASAIATKFFLEHFGSNAILLATATMTILVIIFAEVIPKTYAIYNAEKVSLFVAPILRFLFIFTNPIAKLLRIFVKVIIPQKKIKSRKEDLVSAIEELKGVIELHHREGSVEKDDRDMLDSILELSETDVEAIMTHRKNLFMVDAEQDNKEILEQILKGSFTRIPIYKGNKDNIIGVLHIKDILKAQMYSTKKFDDIDLIKLATKPWFIPESTRLSDQLFAFRKERNHFAIVVDEYGSVMGIVTLEDILEEIVGEIKDEHDKGAIENYKKVSENTFIIDGHITVRDFNRDFDLELPEDDAATMAGFLINLAGHIPERSEVFNYNNFEFTVIEKHKNQIKKLKVRRLES